MKISQDGKPDKTMERLAGIAGDAAKIIMDRTSSYAEEFSVLAILFFALLRTNLEYMDREEKRKENAPKQEGS